MINFDNFIRKYVDDTRHAERGFGGREVPALKVSVPMEMITRFCHA